MGIAIGWSNLAYVLGVLEGEVMRVLLLFYLAPLWTVPLARILLHERLDRRGMMVMALAFAGAMAMLWHPELGVPWPSSRAEWLGFGGGLALRARQRAGAAAAGHDRPGEVDRDLGGRRPSRRWCTWAAAPSTRGAQGRWRRPSGRSSPASPSRSSR